MNTEELIELIECMHHRCLATIEGDGEPRVDWVLDFIIQFVSG